MFDDPNKALKELQERLLEAEEPEEDIFAPPAPQEENDPDAPPEEYDEAPEDAPDEAVTPGREKTRTKTMLLVALLLLEVAALFAVLIWWLLW